MCIITKTVHTKYNTIVYCNTWWCGKKGCILSHKSREE